MIRHMHSTMPTPSPPLIGLRQTDFDASNISNQRKTEQTWRSRDFLSEEPVSDETFAFFLNQYAYYKTELNAVVESFKEEEEWIREKITFDAAYGNERMLAYLFLPKKGKMRFNISFV